MAAILSKFTVLCLSSYFAVYLLKLKSILFYNYVVYYYTRMFLILLPYAIYIYIYIYIYASLNKELGTFRLYDMFFNQAFFQFSLYQVP